MSLLLTPNTTWLGKALRLPLRLIPRETVVTVRRGINRGMKWRVGSNTHGCWLGTYELDKQEAVRRLVKPGMFALDVGANAGFYTLAFSRQVGSAGRVWAVEPFAENVSSLLRHLDLNGVRNVTVFQAAVAAARGTAHFHVHRSNSMGRITDADTALVVPTLSLDALLDQAPVPDVIKMDIEGGELAALQGAPRLLAQRRTTWLIALDDPGNADACRTLLDDAGYAIAPIAADDREIVATPRK